MSPFNSLHNRQHGLCASPGTGDRVSKSNLLRCLRSSKGTQLEQSTLSPLPAQAPRKQTIAVETRARKTNAVLVLQEAGDIFTALSISTYSPHGRGGQ